VSTIRISVVLLLVAGIAATFVVGASRTKPVIADDEGNKVVIRDDCDPDDPAWALTGGCLLKEGDVMVKEFNDELSSPLSVAVIGHQAWRNDPPYLKIKTGEDVKVRTTAAESIPSRRSRTSGEDAFLRSTWA
jgi:hypothetical protein